MLALDFADRAHGLLVHVACSGAECEMAVDATSSGGATWTRVGTVPVTFKSFTFPTLTMVGTDDAVLSGEVDTSEAGGVGFATFDGGHHWQRLALPRFGRVASVVRGTVWATSTHCLAGRYHDRACTNRVYREPLKPDGSFHFVSRAPVSRAIVDLAPSTTSLLYLTFDATHSHRGLLVSRDDGATWQPRRDPCRAVSELSLGVDVQGRTAWALCMDLYGAGSAPKQLFVSTDGGSRWIRRPDPESGGYSGGMDTTTATSAWRFGARGDIYLSTDVGRSWRDALVGKVGGDAAGAATYWLDPLDAEHAWVVSRTRRGNPLFLRTIDGGHTWRRLALPFT